MARHCCIHSLDCAHTRGSPPAPQTHTKRLQSTKHCGYPHVGLTHPKKVLRWWGAAAQAYGATLPGEGEELAKCGRVRTQGCPIRVSAELIRRCHVCAQSSRAQTWFGQESYWAYYACTRQPCPHHASQIRRAKKCAHTRLPCLEPHVSAPNYNWTDKTIQHIWPTFYTKTTFSRLGEIAFASNS